MTEEHCVCCGEIIPEGRQICWSCEHSLDNSRERAEELEKEICYCL